MEKRPPATRFILGFCFTRPRFFFFFFSSFFLSFFFLFFFCWCKGSDLQVANSYQKTNRCSRDHNIYKESIFRTPRVKENQSRFILGAPPCFCDFLTRLKCQFRGYTFISKHDMCNFFMFCVIDDLGIISLMMC